MSKYHGQTELLLYLREQKNRSYYSFLIHHRKIIIESLSSLDTWNALNNIWTVHFLKESENILDKTTYVELKNKVDTEQKRLGVKLRTFWEGIIDTLKNSNKENEKPFVKEKRKSKSYNSTRKKHKKTNQVTTLIRSNEQDVLINVPDGHIHVIVELPIATVKETKPVIYSTINRENFDKFLKHAKLTLNPVEYTGSLSKSDIRPYKWSVSAENNPKQRELIIQYFNQHLKPSLPTNIVIYDVVNDKNLLDIPVTKNSPFPFRMQGGTDIIIVRQDCVDNFVPSIGIYATIELKKVVQRQHIQQAISEMVAANFLADSNIKPIGILTDLNKVWHLFWLGEGGKIIMVKLSNRKKSLEIISKMVKMMRVPGLPGWKI